MTTHFGRILEIGAWPDLAMEALIRLGGPAWPSEASSWLLPLSFQERITVRWPRTYQWQPAGRWGGQMLNMLRRRVNVLVCDLPQPYKGTILTQFDVDGRPFKVAFNISDYPDFIDDRCTQDSVVTFKFQFRDGGYAAPCIVPGGYLPGSDKLYSMLRYLRWSKDHLEPRFNVYGRFSMDFSPEVRGEALGTLVQAGGFDFYGGDRVVPYSRYLREVARSRVCIDLPGQGPLCFRLIEYLAIGSCIVARPHGVRLTAPLVDGVHLDYCALGPDEMVRRCRALLDDPAEQQDRVLAARKFFDCYLHRDQLSAYYLTAVLAAAGVS